MKKSIVLVTVLIGLIALTAVFFLKKEDGSGAIPYEQAFQIDNTNQIHKIFIAHRDGRKVTLEKKTNFWTVNEKFRARQSAIDLVLETSKEMRVKYIPPKAMLKRIRDNLASKGIKITYLDSNDEIIKTYYMGSGDNSGYGTFMVMDNSDDPFVVHIPDFVGGLRARYRLTENEWRDKHVFDLGSVPDAVRMEYPEQSGKSFELVKAGRNYQYTDLSNNEVSKVEKKELAEVFFKAFGTLIAESLESNHPKKDSIITSPAFVNISFDFNAENPSVYHVFPDYNEQYLRGTRGELEGSDSILRFFIYSPKTEDLFLIQNRVFKEILRTKGYFFD